MYHLINESFITAYYCVLFVGTIDYDEETMQTYTDACIYIIIMSWAMNIGLSFILTLFSVFSKICNYIKKRSVVEVRDAPYRMPKREYKTNLTTEIGEHA